MNFPLQNKYRPQRTKGNFFIIFLVLALLLIGVNYASHGAVGNALRTPATVVLSSGGLIDSMLEPVRKFVTSKQALANENERLHTRIRELELYALNNQVLHSENKELRELLHAPERALPVVLEVVQSELGAFPYGTFMISRAHEDMVREGAYVFGPNDVVLGTVAQVGSGYAHVELLSAPNRVLEVVVGPSDTHTTLHVEGIGLGNFRGRIARDAHVEPGAVVRLKALPTSVVGVVGTVTARPADAFKTVHIFVPVTLGSIQYVTVGTI